MNALQAEIQATGTDLVAIGNGTAAMAEDFVSQFAIDYPVYTDPERRTYQAMGWRRGLGINIRMLGHSMRAMGKGFVQGRRQGDTWQQGGEALLSTSGAVLWACASSEAGKHASDAQIRAALAKL